MVSTNVWVKNHNQNNKQKEQLTTLWVGQVEAGLTGVDEHVLAVVLPGT